MHIIKLNATESTNTYLRELYAKNTLEDYTVVVAKHQLKGKGQMGTTWHVEGGKNLTFSVFKRTNSIKIEDQFSISMITSLAVLSALEQFGVPNILVKWPNDILSEEKKICGILIESVIKRQTLEGTMIGIGLNINQTYFENLPRATSMKIQTGQLFNLDEVLIAIVNNLKTLFARYTYENKSELFNAYTNLLFKKDKPSTFRNKMGDRLAGFIKGVDTSGNLVVLHEDNILKHYKFKEIELLY